MYQSFAPLYAFALVSSAGYGFSVLLFVAVGLFIYFTPCLVAMRREANADAAIIVLNIFLGWTVIGWVAALLWALSAETVEEARLRNVALNNMARFYRTLYHPSK